MGRFDLRGDLMGRFDLIEVTSWAGLTVVQFICIFPALNFLSF
jgi:hypothetical protein